MFAGLMFSVKVKLVMFRFLAVIGEAKNGQLHHILHNRLEVTLKLEVFVEVELNYTWNYNAKYDMHPL